MEQAVSKMKGLTVQIEEARNRITEREKELARAEESRKVLEESLMEAEEELKKKEFQEILETVENELVPLYQKERESENQINSFMNKLFERTARTVDKVNLMYKDFDEIKKEIKNAENQIIQSARKDGFAVRESIELKKVQATQDLKVIKQIKGAPALVKQVNTARNIPEGEYEMMFEEDFGNLPIYAQNIYRAIKTSGKSIRAKIDDLIRLSKIPEPRVILARDMVAKFLDRLKKNKLIEYSLSGDTYIIEAIGEAEF